jgi:hypothetical protein
MALFISAVPVLFCVLLRHGKLVLLLIAALVSFAVKEWLAALRTWRQEAKTLAKELAHEMRTSSEELTKFVRSYIVTSEEADKKQFYLLKARRDGLLGGSFRTRIRESQLPFADLLEMALNESDELVDLEEVAFHAVQGWYRPSHGIARGPTRESALSFSVKGPSNPTFAQELVHSSEYIKRKQLIMQPIAEFESRCQAQLLDDIRWLDKHHGVALASLVLCLALLAWMAWAASRRMLEPCVHSRARQNLPEIPQERPLKAPKPIYRRIASSITPPITPPITSTPPPQDQRGAHTVSPVSLLGAVAIPPTGLVNGSAGSDLPRGSSPAFSQERWLKREEHLITEPLDATHPAYVAVEALVAAARREPPPSAAPRFHTVRSVRWIEHKAETFFWDLHRSASDSVSANPREFQVPVRTDAAGVSALAFLEQYIRATRDQMRALGVAPKRHSPNSRVVLGWHGLPADDVDSVLRHGLRQMGRTDQFFFGKGTYVALEPEYAAMYTRRGASPSYTLILYACSVTNVYPVTLEKDYVDPMNEAGESFGLSRFGLSGLGFSLRTSTSTSLSLEAKYDCHFAPVRYAGRVHPYDGITIGDRDLHYQAATEGDPVRPPTAHELVIGNQSRVTPIAIVEFDDGRV